MIRSQIGSPLVLARFHSLFVLYASAFSSIGSNTRIFLGKRTFPSHGLRLSSSSPSQSMIDTNKMSGLPTQQTQLVISLREHLLAAAPETANKSNKRIKLILASQSPRRQEILTMMGLEGLFTVQPSPLDESALQQQLQDTADPEEYTCILATEKAMALARTLVLESKQRQQAEPTASQILLVLGSDTIVAHQGHILEKPIDAADATRMLWKLQGQQHSVHTGVALVAVDVSSSDDNDEPRLVQAFTDTAQVTFASLTELDIATYVATGEPMDKAGSYGIQGVGGQIVTAVHGDFFTVRYYFTACTVCVVAGLELGYNSGFCG